MRWRRGPKGAAVADPDFVDPLERQADAAAKHFGFTDGEREEYLKLQRRLAGNPRAMKQLVKRQRKFARAARMSSTIKRS